MSQYTTPPTPSPSLNRMIHCYARTSSEEQRRNETIQTQIGALQAFCQLQTLPIAEWYVDDGVSGTLALEQRPGGARLLADARAGLVSSLLVYKIDRLGRTPRHILNAVAELEGAGVTIRSATEPFDTVTASGRFLLTVLSGVAGLERDNLLERSREGTDRLARLGTWLGGIVPYGYRVEGEKRHARLVEAAIPLPDMELTEADVVRLIFQLAVGEHYTCPKIASYLNALGVPTAYALAGRGRRGQRTANYWTAARVRNMLTSPTYMGRHFYGKRSPNKARQLIEREVPALVDEVTWRRAKEVLSENRIAAVRNARRTYLLRGLIVCGTCGRGYSGATAGERKDHRERWYYRCNGKQVNRGTRERCRGAEVPGWWLEQIVWEDVEHWIRHADEAVLALTSQRQVETGAAERLLVEARHLQDLAERKQDERDAILSLYRQARITEADLDRQLGLIAAEAESLRRRAGELRHQATRAQVAEREIDSAAETLARYRALLDAGVSEEVKRELIHTLVKRIVIDRGMVTVHTLFGGKGHEERSAAGTR